jgi:methyl-accepting chemotaxis protein
MDIQRLLTSLSLKIIIQFGVVVALSAIAIVWNIDFIQRFYFENQQTQTGVLINSAIATLMLFGMANILYHLLRYKHEEKTIAGFVNNIESIKADLTEGLSSHSIIVKRLMTMKSIQSAAGEINHSALSAMLTADESTKFGLVKFINNILILTGVFGTIVSLSIALLGASDLIDSAAGSLGGMGLVIHGMSTALSTTITAIISYVIFGYFYTRLNDVQTHLISGVEHLTSVYLMPQFVKGNDDIVNKMADLIKSVIHATDKLNNTQEIYQASALTLQETISSNQAQLSHLSTDLSEITSLLTDNVNNTQEIYRASERALQTSISSNQQRVEQLSTELSEVKLLLREGFRLQPVNSDTE